MLELKVRNDGEDLVLQFEHSLLSVSKWEAKYKKPFLSRLNHDPMEMLDYYSMMLLSPELDPNLVYALSPDQMETMAQYINDPQTASSVPQDPNARGSRETMTSELIYYWMVALKINWEAQYWHLNRLMMLIQITTFKQQPEKKQNKAATMARWREANERQKAMFKTKG